MSKWNKKKDRWIKGKFEFYYSISSFFTNLENSLSKRARCNNCENIIGKNTIRGKVVIHRPIEPRTIVRFYCSDCALKYLVNDITDMRLALSKMKTKIRTRKIAYKNQELLRVKDRLLREMENDGG